MLGDKQRHNEGAMAFRNKNGKYETNTEKGYPHGEGRPGGSVFKEPIFMDGYSLWLEHVIEPRSGRDDLYWLMWYDANGRSTTRVSGILSREDLKVLLSKLSSFLEVP